MHIKSIVLIFICSIISYSCFQAKKVEINNYTENYSSIIDDYGDPLFGDRDRSKEIIENNLHIPEKNFDQRFEFFLLQKFEMNFRNGLPKYIFLNSPQILNYAMLEYVFENGDMWFSRVRDSYNYLYIKESNNIVSNESVDEKYRYKMSNEIFLNGEFYPLEYDQKNGVYCVKNKKIIIDKKKEFPIYFQNNVLLSPIISDFSIWRADFPLQFKYNNYATDIMLLLYNWKEHKIKRSILLPITDGYHFFKFGIGGKDSKQRIYFRAPASFRQNYPKMTNGHIMIYDIFNDIMYNIYHPLMQDVTKDEDLLETQYVLGEDENIYYQLVTNKAYYIYKIKPLWNENSEEIEYQTMFFNFYPELKAEWDKLQERTE